MATRLKNLEFIFKMMNTEKPNIVTAGEFRSTMLGKFQVEQDYENP